jgi:aspartyl-tRNA(Asn)/glutamyl-tRNA(Gln) amidotransferase subunit A
MIDLPTLTITKAREALLAGEYTAESLVSAYIKNIEEKNPEINAYLGIFSDALHEAKVFDSLAAEEKKNLPLGGIPIAIKDNILIKGKEATAASKILDGYVAPYNATVIDKLKKAGAIFLGRANMDEFAMGGSTENSAFGVTKNPHDTSRVAGGSSGGSAAAVAMDGALAALGSDTGGTQAYLWQCLSLWTHGYGIIA